MLEPSWAPVTGTASREGDALAPCEGLEGAAGGRCGRTTTRRARVWAPGSRGVAAWVTRPMCQWCARMSVAPTDSQAIAATARRARVHVELIRVQVRHARAISAEARKSGDEHAVTMTGIYLATVGEAWGRALDAQLTISDASRRLARGERPADALRHAAHRAVSDVVGLVDSVRRTVRALRTRSPRAASVRTSAPTSPASAEAPS